MGTLLLLCALGALLSCKYILLFKIFIYSFSIIILTVKDPLECTIFFLFYLVCPCILSSVKLNKRSMWGLLGFCVEIRIIFHFINIYQKNIATINNY